MSKEKSELLPCPFCAQQADWDFNESKNGTDYFIECQSCHVKTPSYLFGLENAVSHWNRRT